MTQNHLTDIVFLNVKLLRVQTMTQHKSIGDRNADADKGPENQVISYRVSIFNCLLLKVKLIVKLMFAYFSILFISKFRPLI